MKHMLILCVMISLIGCAATPGSIKDQKIKRTFEVDLNYIALCRNIFDNLIECHPNRVGFDAIKDRCNPGAKNAQVVIHTMRSGVYYSGVMALWDIYPVGENKSIIKYYDRFAVDVFANSTERWIKNGFTSCEGEGVVNNLTSQDKTNKKQRKDTNPLYKGIKGIVLQNGDVILGQIISIDNDVLKIQTKEGKVFSYSFMHEVKKYIRE